MRISFILFLSFFMFTMSSGAVAESLNLWLQKARAEARAQGISDKIVMQSLPDGFQPLPRVLALDKKQPENTITYRQYVKNVVNQQRIDKGREKIRSYGRLLDQVSATYGVDKEVIVALWAIETNFGTHQGNFDVITALATLAYDGRRADFFRAEMFHAMRIADEQHMSLHDLKGSWAGAMGQCQFMPSSFFRFAQDFDRDGRKDIWNTEADVFASAANYLAKNGWRKGQPWGRKVQLPQGFNKRLIGIKQTHSLQSLYDHGVRMVNGKPLPFEGAPSGSLIQPGGPQDQTYVVYDNYRVILSWNKSSYFGTSVGLLSDLLK